MERNDYLQAAKILATCPTKRLPQVIKMLRDAGIDVDERMIKEEVRNKEEAKMERRGKARERNYDPGFWSSDDDFILTLRNAFERGIGISKLSRVTGLSRTTLYRYLHDEFYPSDDIKETILASIEKIMNCDGAV